MIDISHRTINLSNHGSVVPFLNRLDSSRSITSLRATVSPHRNKIKRPTITEVGGGAVRRQRSAAPGDFYGGHRCRELSYAHCWFSYLHFLLPTRRLRTTAGLTAAPSKTAPVNGAAAITIARAIRAHPRPPAAG